MTLLTALLNLALATLITGEGEGRGGGRGSGRTERVGQKSRAQGRELINLVKTVWTGSIRANQVAAIILSACILLSLSKNPLSSSTVWEKLSI